LLQSILNSYKTKETKHSFKISDFELFLEVSCDFDGTPSRVRISNQATINSFGLFTIRCQNYNLHKEAPAYYAKTGSCDFKTAQDLAEFSAGAKVTEYLLACLQSTSFVSVSSKDFEQAFESMVEELAPDTEETEPKE
jgi:hypothetical protein